jgi:uncharacterized protein
MIAVDTNLLVDAHREDSAWHEKAYPKLVDLAEGQAQWAILCPCLHEFLAIVTHPRIFSPPTPLDKALSQIEAWLESPSLVLLSETGEYWPLLKSNLQIGRISGPQVHDARVAALCRIQGVRELWTADRDFSRFPELKVKNPLVV